MKISHTLSLSETTSLKRDQVLLFLFNSAILLQKNAFHCYFFFAKFFSPEIYSFEPFEPTPYTTECL